MATIYRADDERWARVTQAVKQVEREANAELQRICEAEGIKEDYAPSFYSGLHGPSRERADKDRRAELRKVAQTRVKADAKAAKESIEAASGVVQEQLLVGGLRSEEARALVETIPPVESLMPPLPTAEIVKLEAANGHRRRSWESRQLPPLRVSTHGLSAGALEDAS